MKVLLLALAIAVAASALWLLLPPLDGGSDPLGAIVGRGEAHGGAADHEVLQAPPPEAEARTLADAADSPGPHPKAPNDGAFEQFESTGFHGCLLHVSTAQGHTSPHGHAFAVYIGAGDEQRLFADGRTAADGKAVVPIELLPGDDPRTAWGEVTTPGHLDARYALLTSGLRYRDEEAERELREMLEEWRLDRLDRTDRLERGFDRSSFPTRRRPARPRFPRHAAYRLELRPVPGATVNVIFTGASGKPLRGRLFRTPASEAAGFAFTTAAPLMASVANGQVSYRLRVLEDEDMVYVGRASGNGTGVTTSRELLSHRSDAPFELVIRGASMVNGVVLDAGGAPVVGAELSLTLQERPSEDPVTLLGGGAVTARVVTDKDGQFEARGLREGTFTIRSVAGAVPLGEVHASARSTRQRLSWPRAAGE